MSHPGPQRGNWSHWRAEGFPQHLQHQSPPWMRHTWRGHRQLFFLRFLVFFGAISLLVIGVMAAVAFLLTRQFGGDGQVALAVWASGCALFLVLPLLVLAFGARAFRSFAIPLADIMDAADAVAEGNFDVQVAERGAREFRRLAHSFNRMTAELARTDEQRRNLTADVAHELRTPLHIIRGNLEGILDGVYAPTPDHVEATLQETRTLSRLVDDLRTLSLAESGELPLNREPIEVVDLLADVVTSFSVQAETAGIDLRYVVDDESPSDGLTLAGDPGRLDQVLSNLVANGIRHTAAGGSVLLSATASASSVRLCVTDTGEGILPDDLPFVFDRFWRGDRARSHAGGPSTGLGLAIAAQLVRAHGGEIHVTSTVGRGATFRIDLPRAANVAQPTDDKNND